MSIRSKTVLVAAAAAAALVLTACEPNPGVPEGGAGAEVFMLLEDVQEGVSPAPAATAETFSNLPYIPEGTSGHHAKHVLDLTVPSGDGPFPLVIFLHGGGFTGGSKGEVTSTASAPNTAGPKGYAVASIGYRLVGNEGGTFPKSFNDILTAIRFLRANAGTYRLDPNRFAVTGFSAGAYHAGMVTVLAGYDNHGFDGFPELYPNVSSKVQAGVTYAALTDMALLKNHEAMNPGVNYLMTNHGATSPEAQLLGNQGALYDLPENPGSIRWQANPLNYVNTNTPPLMMIHAIDDNIVPWQQSELLVDKINSVVSGRAVFDKQTSGGHSGFPGRANDIYKFLDEQMPAGGSTGVKETEREIR